MKGLQMSDVYAAMRVIEAAKISDEVEYIASLINTDKKVKAEKIGLLLFLKCGEKLSNVKAETAMYGFIGRLLEKSKEEIEKADPLDLFEMLREWGANYLGNDEKKEQAKRFFYLCGLVNERKLKELLLRRWGAVGEMPAGEFIELAITAIEAEREEHIRAEWLACYPYMCMGSLKFMAFSEYMAQRTGANIDTRPTEEIIKEIEKLHGGL